MGQIRWVPYGSNQMGRLWVKSDGSPMGQIRWVAYGSNPLGLLWVKSNASPMDQIRWVTYGSNPLGLLWVKSDGSPMGKISKGYNSGLSNDNLSYGDKYIIYYRIHLLMQH